MSSPLLLSSSLILPRERKSCGSFHITCHNIIPCLCLTHKCLILCIFLNICCKDDGILTNTHYHPPNISISGWWPYIIIPHYPRPSTPSSGQNLPPPWFIDIFNVIIIGVILAPPIEWYQHNDTTSSIDWVDTDLLQIPQNRYDIGKQLPI